ncbi:hypothetical protein WC29P1_00042 [Weissella phage WC29P1]|nr:hypothetical protein WC29P1_00042 [Weissella phage WC29P1]
MVLIGQSTKVRKESLDMATISLPSLKSVGITGISMINPLMLRKYNTQLPRENVRTRMYGGRTLQTMRLLIGY